MKKMKIANAGIALMAVMILAMFTACPTDDGGGGGPTLSDAKALTTLTVGGVSPDGGIPTAITAAEWADSNTYLTALPGAVGYVYLQDSSVLTSVAFSATVSNLATVAFATGDGDNRTSTQFDVTSPTALTEYEYLFVRVTAENGSVNYYAIMIRLANTNANLTNLTVADIHASVGTPAATWNDVNIVSGTVSLTNAVKSNATVVATTSAAAATAKYVKVTGAGAPDFSTFTAGPITFANGDFLYVEVTAVDGTTKLVYKVEIWIGRNADLANDGITFGEQTVTSIGTGAATLAEVAPGYIVFTKIQPIGGFEVEIIPEDDEATIAYAAGGANVTESSITNSYTTPTPIAVADTEFLYVKVTSASTDVVKYYKILVGHKQTATITAGTPVIKANSEKYIDPIWDSVTEVYQINKIAPFGDTTADYRTQGTSHPRYTYGTAKALWDYDGMWVYVDVVDSIVNGDDPGWTTSTAHQYDSFELFINENLDELTSTPGTLSEFQAYSGQYRVGADGKLSGHASNALAAFQSLNKASAWKKDDNSGYVIIMQAPWLHASESGLVPADGKAIGFELQINACYETSTRDGVMVWNNIAHSNYQTNSAYGEAILTGTPKTHAQIPQIAAHPADNFVEKDQSLDLSVNASITDSGTLSYQWYSSTTSTGAGTAVGTDSNTYTVDTSTIGVTYYYVVVTNTNTSSNIDGNTVVSVTSNYARVEVGVYEEPLNWEEKITIVNTNAPVYGFNLPAGKTFADYDRLVVKIRMDPNSPNKNGRLRAWGSYPLTQAQADLYTTPPTPWTTVGNRPSMGNDGAYGAGGKLLNDAGEVDYASVTEWTEYTINFNKRDDNADAIAIKGASGLVTVAFAIVPPGGGSGTRVYYVKDIVLSDGTNTVPALYPEHPRLWRGEGSGAYVTQNGNDVPSRELGWMDRVTNSNSSAPVYGFQLPSGKTFADYNRVTVKIKTGDDGSIGATSAGRLRLWGAYKTTDWTGSTPRDLGNVTISATEPTTGQLLLVTGAYDNLVVATGGGWVTYTLPLNEASKLHADIKALDGIILLGFAPIPQGGASGGPHVNTWYVNGGSIRLEATTTTTEEVDTGEVDDETGDPIMETVTTTTVDSYVNAIRPDSTRLWGPAGATNFAQQSGSGPVTRELQPDSFFVTP